MIESRKVYRNFNRKNRFLGLIDYKTLTLLLGYMWIVWKIGSIFFTNAIYSVYFLIFLIMPVIGLVYANRNEDDISHIMYVIFKFIISPKMYTFKLTHKKYWVK